LERQSLIFIQCSNNYLAIAKETREGSDCLEDDSEVFRKFPVPEGTFGRAYKVAGSFGKATESV